jgi:hypothetical protein
MKPLVFVTLAVVILGLTGCVATPQVSVTPPSGRSSLEQQQDGLRCLEQANNIARGSGGGFSDPMLARGLEDKAREQYFVACLRSHGYQITY